MSEANGIQVAEVVAQQLESLLEAGNYDGARFNGSNSSNWNKDATAQRDLDDEAKNARGLAI